MRRVLTLLLFGGLIGLLVPALPGDSGTWFQVTALTSTGAGASLPNGPSAGPYPVAIPMPEP